MLIGMYHRTNKPFLASKFAETPFGGAERQAFHIARHLSKKHQVVTFCNVDKPYFDGNYVLDRYENIKDYKMDVFICVRADDPINPRYHGRFFTDVPPVMILLSGDDSKQSNNAILMDTLTIQYLDKIVVKSDWQKQTFIDDLFVPEDKLITIRNGIDLTFFEGELPTIDKNRLIHAATVYRGCPNFIKLFPMLKERMPDLRLNIFSKTSLYTPNNYYDDQFAWVFDKLSAMDGVTVHDPVPQQELAEWFKQSFLYIYPNSGFVETSCNSVLESTAAGCPVIVSDRGGIKENMFGSGKLVTAEPESDEWYQAFVDNVEFYYNNPDARHATADHGRHLALKTMGWQTIIEQWHELLGGLHG